MKLSVISLILSGLLCPSLADGQKILKASQCFKSRGIPKVSFGCPSGQLIKITRAFHGISSLNDKPVTVPSKKSTDEDKEECMPSPGHDWTNCTYCPGDCIDDSMNLVYDWSTCMGNTTCTRTVMQSYMPACSGRDKFSDYLQVEYQCVQKKNVMSICGSSIPRWLREGYIMSPGYPDYYPSNQDCLCRLETDNTQSRLTMSFYDLLLETKKGRCRADWLMLRQSGQKHRHCGAIMTGVKNITSTSNTISLQFHSDKYDNRSQNFQYFRRALKGFWLRFVAEPQSSVQVHCRRLTPSDHEVREISDDDADYDEVISTRDMMMTTVAPERKITLADNTPKHSRGPEPESAIPTTNQGKPNNKRGGGKNRYADQNKTNKENAVDYQEGGQSSGANDTASLKTNSLTRLIFLLSTLLIFRL